MANTSKKPAELGPEGVPLDAPDNEGPAISPQAVSRMHRAEDDRKAIERSPEFSDSTADRVDDRRDQEHWRPGAPGSHAVHDASRGLDAAHAPRDPNPAHDTRKDASASPRGRGDGELQEQPASTQEARQPGADNPKFDE